MADCIWYACGDGVTPVVDIRFGHLRYWLLEVHFPRHGYRYCWS